MLAVHRPEHDPPEPFPRLLGAPPCSENLPVLVDGRPVLLVAYTDEQWERFRIKPRGFVPIAGIWLHLDTPD